MERKERKYKKLKRMNGSRIEVRIKNKMKEKNTLKLTAKKR